MVSTYLVIWVEALDAKGRIVFQWNDRVMLVEEAFERLQKTLDTSKEAKTKVKLVIRGRLGQHVQWESSFATPAKHAAREVFKSWYTQAVQAQAALVKQRVMRPSFK